LDLEHLEPGTAQVSEAPRSGETLTDLRVRVAAAIDDIVMAHPDSTVIIVGHSIAGRAIICHLLGCPVESVWRLKLKVASVSMVRISDDGAVLERLGDTLHLSSIRHAGSSSPSLSFGDLS
jgi:broad specificity phosphatase PhoE